MVSVLHKKLWRDLWRLRASVLAISLIVASGIALMIGALNTIKTIEVTRQVYYDQSGFGDLFANAHRVPRHLRHEIAALPGVRRMDDKVVGAALIDLPSLKVPARGQLISIDPALDGGSTLNRVLLDEGRMPMAQADHEVVAHFSFAKATGLELGDEMSVTMRGRRMMLKVVGIGSSADTIYAMPAGSILPDEKGYGIFWVNRDLLDAIYDYEGAFNSLIIDVERDANAEILISRIDQILAPFGGTGSYDRGDHPSNAMLDNEIEQLTNMVRVIPVLFLAIAAFLINVIMGRLVALEREQIGLFKAFGMRERRIALHYLGFAVAITFMGGILGVIVGFFLSSLMAELYQIAFRFPFMLQQNDAASFLIGMSVSLAAAVAGAFTATRRVMALEPAEAMAPEPPTSYKPTFFERMGLTRSWKEPSRMVLRHVMRRPWRALVSVTGLSLAVAIVILGNYFGAASETLIDTYFYRNQTQDLTISLVEARPKSAQFSLEGIDGVLRAEGSNGASVKLRYGPVEKRTGIIARSEGAVLSQVMNEAEEIIAIPKQGIVLSKSLAEQLHVAVGDLVTVELLTGQRYTREVPVTAIIKLYIGQGAYMSIEAFGRLTGEAQQYRQYEAKIDPEQLPVIVRELMDLPMVQSVTTRLSAFESFGQMMERSITIMGTVFGFFAALIAVGVVYNSARIALSEQARELASLRVLGYSVREAGFILIGQLVLLTVLSFVPGAVLGYYFSFAMSEMMQNDLMRMPFSFSSNSVILGILIVSAAAIGSAMLVGRRVAHLDLVAVLKSRE